MPGVQGVQGEGHTFHDAIQTGIHYNQDIAILGQPPVQYNSVQQYIEVMPHPHSYASFIEISAFEIMFNKHVHILGPRR